MRGLAFLVAGILIGGSLMHSTQAQGEGVLALNHIGISVEDLDDTVNFYTQTLGLREAFAVRDDDGNPILTYLQISRDSFLEVQPAGPNRPPGLTHIGLQVNDLPAMAERLRQQGMDVNEPITGRTRALLTNTTEGNGIRIELLELGPESLQMEAMEAWR